jgi:hypothetical protein
MAATYRPPITPTLVLCLGDFGERVAQALIPELEVAGPAMQAAVRWLRITWPEGDGVQLTDGSGQALLKTGEDDPELWVAIRGQVEEALRSIGLHATREQLVRAGYGLHNDPLAGRWARCYLIAALREASVLAIMMPLLTHVNALLIPRHGPSSIAAFLNVATHSLDPDAPQRATVAAARQSLPDLVAGQPDPGLWPCVLLDWVKTGGVFAQGDEELGAALVALLRVLLLADEPAALLQRAFPQPPAVDSKSSAFCSLGVAVIQSPPREAVLDWLAARLMAEYLSRRCLDPLEGPQEITLGTSQQVADCLKLAVILEALAEGLDAEITAEPGLSIPMNQGAFGQPPITEAMITKAGHLLVDQVGRNQSALEAHLVSEAEPIGQLPSALAREIGRGPHGLWSAEALLTALAEEVKNGQTLLAQKLARGPLSQEQLIERVGKTRVALNAIRRTVPGPNTLLIKSGLVATLWGYLFGTWAGRVWGAGEMAGTLLTAVWVIIAVGLWYVLFKRWQIRRAQQDYLAAVAALQSAQVEKTWLEAAQGVLTASEAWRERQAERLRATRKLLTKVQEWLAECPLQLPSAPVNIETLPYLDGYTNWLQTVLQGDPLMLEVQTTLEGSQMRADWPDLKENALLKALIGAGRQALFDVPELSVEEVLTIQGEKVLKFHLERLHQLATPLIDLNRTTIPSPSGGPSTFDIICCEQGTAARLRGWLDNHWLGSTSIAITGDPQRVTCVRLVPGFDLGDSSDCS